MPKELTGSNKPIDKDILNSVIKRNKQVEKMRARSVVTKEMIAKYGATGLEKNSIPQDFQSEEKIAQIREVLDGIDKYKNVEKYEFIPIEFANKMKAAWKHIEFLCKVDEKTGMPRATAKNPFIAFPKGYIYCQRCGGYKDVHNFYKSMVPTADGYLHYCKECLKKMTGEFYDKYKDLRYTLLMMCLYTNIIFYDSVVKMAIKNLELKGEDPSYLYFYYRTELHEKVYKGDGKSNMQLFEKIEIPFERSNFDGNIFKFVEPFKNAEEVRFEEQNPQGRFIPDGTEPTEEDLELEKKKVRNSMQQKWGPGFTKDEYQRMEKLFGEISKFKSKKNVIQTNALIEYVRLKVKLDGAIGKGDLKEIEKWQKLTDSAAKNAGIKLDQLTAEDFGEGVDSWTSLVEMVEEYNTVIPLMPKVKTMPYDDIDFIIWEVVNYCRRLQELPEVSYEDVWNYIDERFISEMRRRGYTPAQIKKEREKRDAIFQDLGDNYVEPLWLNPNLEPSGDDDDE